MSVLAVHPPRYTLLESARDYALEKLIAQGGLQAARQRMAATMLELLGHLERLMGTNIGPRFGPPRPGDVPHSLADLSRAKADLGWQPRTSIGEGLEQVAAWFRGRVVAA